MKHFLQRLLFTMALCISTSNVYAQSAVPVIEVGPNLAVDTTTSVLMGYQVWNSSQEVRLQTLLEEYGRRNLIPNSGGGGDDLLAFLKRLDEVLGESNALHYQLADLKQKMLARYPGYVDPGNMRSALDGTTKAVLHTQLGTLLTAREQMKLSEVLREETVLSGLAGASRSARGNLAVTQATNAILIELIREVRKLRQIQVATLNAQTVATTHMINQQSGQDRSFNDWMERSQITTIKYSGEGGFGPDTLGW